MAARHRAPTIFPQAGGALGGAVYFAQGYLGLSAATFRSDYGTVAEDEVTIGHACIIHACTLKPRAFVGMGATVLDGATIEEGGMLAAGSVLPPGKVIGRYEQWMGNPAKLRKLLTEEERAGFDRTATHYAELAGRHRTSLE